MNQKHYSHQMIRRNKYKKRLRSILHHKINNQYIFFNKLNNQLFIFYSILLLITWIIVGYSFNGIYQIKIEKQIKTYGINYDSFRYMDIPVRVIKEVISDIKNKPPSQKKSSWNNLDRLAMTMMMNQYDIKEKGLINKSSMKYLYPKLLDNEGFKEIKKYLYDIFMDVSCFPVINIKHKDQAVSFDNTWYSYRSYGGNRRHEGTDLLPDENISGLYPIVSMTDGVVEKIGWLEQGGYRIGIRSKNGVYYYYAHLDSYANDLNIGDEVKAGDILGLMGDSGYGEQGTKGKFVVHLHLGIYVDAPFGELSVNPYWILRYLATS